MLAGLIIGCAVGLLWPAVGKELFPVSRAFINALRMLIIPLVFSSIVLGIYHMGREIRVFGKVIGIAFVWFYVATAACMVIGLVMNGIFHPGIGADTMVNFSTISNSQGNYVGDTIELDKFSNIHSISDVLHHLSTDAHGNAVVDLGHHDSITFQGINAATIQANAMHMFILHSTSGNMA